jgi:hypothetical protein
MEMKKIILEFQYCITVGQDMRGAVEGKGGFILHSSVWRPAILQTFFHRLAYKVTVLFCL